MATHRFGKVNCALSRLSIDGASKTFRSISIRAVDHHHHLIIETKRKALLIKVVPCQLEDLWPGLLHHQALQWC